MAVTSSKYRDTSHSQRINKDDRRTYKVNRIITNL